VSLKVTLLLRVVLSFISKIQIIMNENQKGNRYQRAGNLPKEKANEVSKSKEGKPDDLHGKQRNPYKEVPNVGDYEKEKIAKDLEKNLPDPKNPNEIQGHPNKALKHQEETTSKNKDKNKPGRSSTAGKRKRI
jgi:hypothetical protein